MFQQIFDGVRRATATQRMQMVDTPSGAPIGPFFMPTGRTPRWDFMTPDFDTSLEGQVSFLYVVRMLFSVGLCSSHLSLETYPNRVLVVSQSLLTFNG